MCAGVSAALTMASVPRFDGTDEVERNIPVHTEAENYFALPLIIPNVAIVFPPSTLINPGNHVKVQEGTLGFFIASDAKEVKRYQKLRTKSQLGLKLLFFFTF